LSASAARREAISRAALLAAYREGLGLAGLVVIPGPGGTQVVTASDGRDHAPASLGDPVAAQWWCRRAADAERVAAAAPARLRRLESQDGTASRSAVGSSQPPSDISAAIELAAKRLRVTLYSDEDISADAERAIVRVEKSRPCDARDN
jgi:hypothetical protein